MYAHLQSWSKGDVCHGHSCAQLFWYGRRVWLEEGCCNSPCKSFCGCVALPRAGGHKQAAVSRSGQERSTAQAGTRRGAGMEPIGTDECRQPLLDDLHSPAEPGMCPRGAVYRRMAITAVCITGLIYCAAGLGAFVVGLWWRSQSPWSLLAPIVCIIVLTAALLARHCKERGCHRNTTNWWETCIARVQSVLAYL